MYIIDPFLVGFSYQDKSVLVLTLMLVMMLLRMLMLMLVVRLSWVLAFFDSCLTFIWTDRVQTLMSLGVKLCL